MTEPLAPAELVNPEELVALRRDAQRYRWLRTHAVRIQGSEIWYAGDALDIRVDVGVEHIALAKDVTPKRITTRKRR
ncbi:TPA: hypothetical protein ACNVPX_006602 [Pseudomonas aeruginosa]|uniref:hypothetical protein n=1 Tax=Pseudomonas aeruginosa TaxID=287 RepID=UPI001E0AC74F|nr:hypothetical protein [Pseudomonas aeruginosa]MBN0748337.1 hypothetical protein [Pseudomonas aeruginosa]MCT0357553.1 hypothetical protein [Pseudomonas aeruginosa]MCT0387750.1 hypothetical protein [Pseudomonas aeruginosa]MDY1346706.1 hypothetical protein [Pseudomonas aeruginosa]HBO8818631.1 hypothetical protein [Pseudomonas aeruginosa]